MIAERFFKILFTRDGFLFIVYQLQSEVTYYPHEAGEVLCVFLRVSLLLYPTSFDLNVLGKVDNQTKLLESVFIDATHAVIYEKTSEQDCQGENSDIMVRVFV